MHAGSFGSFSAAFRTVGYIALVMGIAQVAGFIHLMGQPGIVPGLADKDFANYWASAHLAADGRIGLIFGPNEPYLAHLRSVLGPEFPWHNWSYPPHYLLLMMPLALVGYKAGIVLFLGVTGLLFAVAVRAFTGPGHRMLALVAVAPLVVVNVWTVQNGFLTSGLILLALALRDRRPVLAGICLGVMSIKPQLALLLPLLMLIERRWTIIAVASATTAALVALSLLAFGSGAWEAYLDTVIPYQKRVMMELGGFFLAMMPSAFGALRLLGLASEQALPLHLLLAGAAGIALVAGLVLVRDREARATLVLIATFLVTPYSLIYDMGCLGAAYALFIAREERAGRAFDGGERVLLAIAMLLPVLMVRLGPLLIPTAPIILPAVFLLMLARAGVPAMVATRLGRRAAA